MEMTRYAYDAAGRLVKEGDKSYSYGYLDKILSVQESGRDIANFAYHLDGQLAAATQDGKTENFLWDGLALIHRGETSFLNEPYITGGNPLLSSQGSVLFNDLLGSTLGVKGEKFAPVKMSAFGESADKNAFFTGKPAVGELGYAFLFRNYRAEQGKWNSQDPMALVSGMPTPAGEQHKISLNAQLGYPDGWNNLAYGNNNVFSGVDVQGTAWVLVSDNIADLMQPPPATGWKGDNLTPGSLWRLVYAIEVQNLVITPEAINESGDRLESISRYSYTAIIISTTHYKDEHGNERQGETRFQDPITVTEFRVKVYRKEE